MAACVDASGNGTVNYHTGATCLTFSRTGGGYHFADNGSTILLAWDAKGGVTRRHETYAGDTSAVEARLGPNFGARLVLATREFELYFACKVRRRTVCGCDAND